MMSDMTWLGIGKEGQERLEQHIKGNTQMAMANQVIPEAAKLIPGLLRDIANDLEDDAIRKINSEYLGLRIEKTKADKRAAELQIAYRSLEPFLKQYDRRPEFRAKAKAEAIEIFKQSLPESTVKILRVKRNPLAWSFEAGTWEAKSHYHDDWHFFVWRVGVCEDGTFCVSDSDQELTDTRKTWGSLGQAKEFCELSETASIAIECGKWINEDELPDEYPQVFMYPFSALVHGCRVYPVVEWEEIQVQGTVEEFDK